MASRLSARDADGDARRVEVGQVGDLDTQGDLSPTAFDDEGIILSYPKLEKLRVPIIGIMKHSIARLGDDIARFYSGAGGRRPRHNGRDDDTGVAGGPDRPRKLRLNSNPRPPYDAVRKKIFRHASSSIYRNGEPDAHRPAARRENGAVDADYFSGRIHQRAA